MKKHEIKYPNLEVEMSRNGDTQKKLADLLNITQQTVSKKLAGKVDWTIGEIEIICEHYNKDYYQLFK